MKLYKLLPIVMVSVALFAASSLHAQIVTYAAPTVTYYAPAAPVTAYYAAPTTSFYAPAPPVTTYYAPTAAVTSYYAPATTTVLSPVAPAATVVRTPVWVYDPTRILPGPRWRLVY